LLRLLVGTLLLLAVQSTGRVEIVVRDATTREGIPGVSITLTSRSPNEPAGPPNTMFTDPRGLALFAALNAGPYTISLGEAYRAQGSSMPSYVLVEPGTSRRVDISVKGIATVTGRIVDQNGGPSAAAVIALLSTVYVDGRQSLRVVGTNTIDSEGNFRLTGVSFGEYYLRIENQSPWSVAYYPGVTDPSAAQKVTVRDPDLFLGDIRLPNPSRFKVSGTVFHSPDAGGALTVYMAHESTIVEEEPFLASVSSTRTSSSEVRFELNDIPAGSYTLYLVVGNRALGSLGKETLRIDDRDIQGLGITLKPMVGIAGRIVVRDAQTRFPENLRIATPSRDSLPPLLVSDLSRSAIAVSRTGEFAVRNLVDGGRYGISLQGLPTDAYVPTSNWEAEAFLPTVPSPPVSRKKRSRFRSRRQAASFGEPSVMLWGSRQRRPLSWPSLISPGERIPPSIRGQRQIPRGSSSFKVSLLVIISCLHGPLRSPREPKRTPRFLDHLRVEARQSERTRESRRKQTFD
jgi:hypothetical protein